MRTGDVQALLPNNIRKEISLSLTPSTEIPKAVGPAFPTV
jgi:hypothetical protein